MNKRICMVLVLCLLFSVTVVSANSVVGGPYMTPNQHISVSRWITPQELEEELYTIEARSNGRLVVDVLGETTQGRPIMLAKFGEPCEDKVHILVQSQMHGNEMPGTEAAMDLIKTLATSGNREVRNILDKVTVWFMPMLNPDGAGNMIDGERVPTRVNQQPWDPSEWNLDPDVPTPHYYRTHSVEFGFDINRDFHGDFDFRLSPETAHHLPGSRIGWTGDFGFYVTPEARASAYAYQQLQPVDFFIDLHTQPGTLVDEDGNMVTLIIVGEGIYEDGYTDIDGNEYPMQEGVIDLSKQVNSLVYQKLNERGNSLYGSIVKYQDLRFAGMALAVYQLHGSGMMLYEMRGAGHHTNKASATGQKQNGVAIQQAYIGMYETLKGFADGSVYDINPAFYDEEIPYWGTWVSNPRF